MALSSYSLWPIVTAGIVNITVTQLQLIPEKWTPKIGQSLKCILCLKNYAASGSAMDPK